MTLIISTQVLSNVETHKDRYKRGGNVKLFTIPLKSIVITDNKSFIKIENLAYFIKIKKYLKV